MPYRDKLSKTSDKIRNDLNAKLHGKTHTLNLPTFQGFGGGNFGGAGTGSDWDYPNNYVELPQYERRTPIITKESFSQAFNRARTNGDTTFEFNGRIYTTEISDNPQYIGKRYQDKTSVVLREVLDDKMKVMSDSTRVEPFVGQPLGVRKRDKSEYEYSSGGILKAQNSSKLPGGYAQYNGSDLSDIETFNKNWLNYRNKQLAKQGWQDENIKNKLNWFQRNVGVSEKTIANLVREQLFSNLDNTKELSFSDALKDSQGRYLLTESMYADFPGERKLHEVEIGPPKPVEDWKLDYSFNDSVAGTHYPDFNTIIYNDLYQNTSTKIHERDHAMFGKYDGKNIALKIVENIFKHEFLDNVVGKWGYYDEPGEIRARLMQMRYNNRLDPNHKYTLDEIENMRNDPTFIDEHIFDRYTNKYIEYLLNYVAQNSINKNRLDYRSPINFAKNGGILKALDYANYIIKKPT